MTYWAERENLEYYQTVRTWLEEFGGGTLLDVGCCDTPVATWGQFDERITVDPRPRPALMGVRQVIGSWPDCASVVPRCDVLTCLQVLEHLADPTTFCAALFGNARRAVILSVPWGWEAGWCKSHVQDPVDAAKLRGWTGREPDRLVVIGKHPRAVGLFLQGP